jgi:RNA polymerase sigma-70 factor, ECF subfamily
LGSLTCGRIGSIEEERACASSGPFSRVTMNEIEILWEKYHAALRRFIRRRVREDSVADDILQDVFVKIHSGMAALRDRNRIQGWLYRIARNTIVDHYRRLRPMEELPESVSIPDRDERRALRELAGCVRPLIARLPEADRQALILSELQGLTQKQVGEKLGLSLSGAKSRVQRGRAKLKKLILQCCHMEFDHRGEIAGYNRKKDGCGVC